MSTQKPHEHQTEQDHDKVLEDSFPASDPPANSGVTGAEPPANTSEIPTGRPTSDRSGAETAAGRDQSSSGTGKK